MKIVSLITELSPAGAERVLTDLVRGLISRGHTCDVVSLMPPPRDKSLVKQLQDCGVMVTFLNATKWDFAVLPFLVRYALLHLEPEVVHAHLMHANLLSRMALAGTGIPLVNTIHIADRRRMSKFFFMLDRMTFRSANVVTAVSKAAVRFHSAACSIPEDQFRVVYNGCDAAAPASAAECEALRMGCMMSNCSRVIGSVGRLDWQKGYDMLFDRMAALADRVPKDEHWGVIVLGDGPDRYDLEKRLRAMNFPRLSAALPGYRPNASSLMSMFDAFVMPSRFEGYGLTLAEAMSFGLPVVTSGVDSLPELCALYHGFSRSVDFERDTDGTLLADALVDALKEGRSQPCILFSTSEMVDQYETIYNELTVR